MVLRFNLAYLEYLKKMQQQRPETCYCNTCDTRARPSSEIQAKYQIETAQVTDVDKYVRTVRINAAKPRSSFGRKF